MRIGTFLKWFFFGYLGMLVFVGGLSFLSLLTTPGADFSMALGWAWICVIAAIIFSSYFALPVFIIGLIVVLVLNRDRNDR